MTLRPDEEASISQIERDKRLRKGIASAAGTAVGLASAGSLATLAPKIMPFLNKFVPVDLAMKGINKVSPKLGNFLKRGMSMGLTPESGLDFIKDSVEEAKPAKQAMNIIEQESPELHKFLDQEIRKGRKPIEAAALAQNDKKFSSIIKNLMKKHKTPWSSIIESVFGAGEMGLPQQGQQQQPQQESSPIKEQLLKEMRSLSQVLSQ